MLSFDPNVRKKLWRDTDHSEMLREFLFAADIALLGGEEGALLLDTEDPSEMIRLLREHGVRYIAVKDGGDGAWCADEKETVRIPPEKCRPVDPVGAGDGFNAAFLCGILEGLDILTCGRMGAIVGAMATETASDIEGYPTRGVSHIRRQSADEEESE